MKILKVSANFINYLLFLSKLKVWRRKCSVQVPGCLCSSVQTVIKKSFLIWESSRTIEDPESIMQQQSSKLVVNNGVLDTFLKRKCSCCVWPHSEDELSLPSFYYYCIKSQAEQRVLAIQLNFPVTVKPLCPDRADQIWSSLHWSGAEPLLALHRKRDWRLVTSRGLVISSFFQGLTSEDFSLYLSHTN
jgi:hypothetical protein